MEYPIKILLCQARKKCDLFLGLKEQVDQFIAIAFCRLVIPGLDRSLDVRHHIGDLRRQICVHIRPGQEKLSFCWPQNIEMIRGIGQNSHIFAS